jgi:hypothetical protein
MEVEGASRLVNFNCDAFIGDLPGRHGATF